MREEIDRDIIYTLETNFGILEARTIYFYDAGHTAEDHEKAFIEKDHLFKDLFVAVIDDWEFEGHEFIPDVTLHAFSKLNYRIEAFWHLSKEHKYHNGLGVFVISKGEKHGDTEKEPEIGS